MAWYLVKHRDGLYFTFYHVLWDKDLRSADQENFKSKRLISSKTVGKRISQERNSCWDSQEIPRLICNRAHKSPLEYYIKTY
jgi:hypothetical protein